MVAMSIVWIAMLVLGYFSNRREIPWAGALGFAIWQCAATAMFVPLGRALYKAIARTTKDGSQKLAKVGDLVRATSIPRDTNGSLMPRDVAALRSMAGDIYEVREIDESGTAWVWKEMPSGRRAVGLAAHEMQLIYPVHRRRSSEPAI